MNTYNVSVNGKEVLTQIHSEELEGSLKILRGLVWASGGSDKDIEVFLNNTDTTT
jgi:hypothetical protein